MKSPSEIQSEVVRLEQVAAVFRADYRREESAVRARAAAMEADPFAPDFATSEGLRRSPFMRALVALPVSVVHARDGRDGDGETLRTYRVSREIAVELATPLPSYLLLEEREECNRAGQVVGSDGVYVALTGDSLGGLLEEGYTRIAEDELAERLLPVLETMEEHGEHDADANEIAEVAEAIGVGLLTSTNKLKAKAAIVEFLEGRLEANDFIAQAVEWQRQCDGHRETQTERQAISLRTDEH